MDIDLVYTWVNHYDSKWLEIFKTALKDETERSKCNPIISDSDIARFTNRNELYYSIKSVYKYAPWVRNIYVVSNCELPNWVDQFDKIIKIDHEDIFPELSVLPTFNSHAIEANLHRIDGLSEHFLYFNDDVFLCRKVNKSDFFSGEKKAYLFPCKHDIPYDKYEDLNLFEYATLNACRLLIKDFNFKPRKKLHHSPFPLLKSTLFELEEKYGEILKETSKHKFRHIDDLPMATTLHAYYSLIQGYGEIKEIKSRYIDIGDPIFVLLTNPFSPLRRGQYTTCCFNEVSSMKYCNGIRDRYVESLMCKMFQ